MKTEIEIIELINSQGKEIIESIKPESVRIYLSLKLSVEKKFNIKEDMLFQFAFLSHFRMKRKDFPKKYCEQYFHILEKCRKEPSLFKLDEKADYFLNAHFLRRKKDKKKSSRFPSVIRLHHFLDNSKPLYDMYVFKTCGIPQYFYSCNAKLNELLDVYQKIENLYLSLTKNNSLLAIIGDFDKKFNYPVMDISMKYHFIFSQAGKLSEKKDK
jgi:hypothetical protein